MEKKYQKLEKVSEGSYGVVYRGRNTENGQIVAMKKFKNITKEGIPVSCIRQIHVLNLLRNCEPEENFRLLKLYEICRQKENMMIVCEWLDMNLLDHIKSLHQKPSPQSEQNHQQSKQLFNKVAQVNEGKDEPQPSGVSTSFQAKKMLFLICKSLQQLHQQLIVHRDLKPLNIMLSNARGLVKVIDYGMAREIEEDCSFEFNQNHNQTQNDFNQEQPNEHGLSTGNSKDQLKVIGYQSLSKIPPLIDPREMTNQVGSLYYRAPQLLAGQTFYSFEIDIWSLGCIFYEMLTGKILFKGQNQHSQLSTILQTLGIEGIQQWTISDKIKNTYMKLASESEDPKNPRWKEIELELKDPLASDLLKRMLSLNAKERPSIPKILADCYLAECSHSQE